MNLQLKTVKSKRPQGYLQGLVETSFLDYEEADTQSDLKITFDQMCRMANATLAADSRLSESPLQCLQMGLLFAPYGIWRFLVPFLRIRSFHASHT